MDTVLVFCIAGVIYVVGFWVALVIDMKLNEKCGVNTSPMMAAILSWIYITAFIIVLTIVSIKKLFAK